MSEERPGSAAGEAAMKVALLTREYPPDVYGGAGVHVEYLSRELAKRGTASATRRSRG